MRRKALAGRPAARPVAAAEPFFPLPELAHYVEGWLVAGEASMHAATILSLRRTFTDNLLWFLRREKAVCCGLTELRAFFAYLVRGHADSGARWGTPQQTRPVRTMRVNERSAGSTLALGRRADSQGREVE